MKWMTREKVKVDRVALGLSDHEILEREFIVYDALYAECQRRVASKAARLARVYVGGIFVVETPEALTIPAGQFDCQTNVYERARLPSGDL